jgi:hypothetical protein
LSENLKGRNHSEDLSVDGRITLECILGKRWEVVHTLFWLENLKREDHSEDLIVDGRSNIRMDLGEIWFTIPILMLVRNQWRALVSTIMNLQVSQKAGNFLTS